MKGRRNLKIAVLLFVMVFAVGVAFAATNGMLAFGGTVRINSIADSEVLRLEFTDLSAVPWDESILDVSVQFANLLHPGAIDTGYKRLWLNVEVFDVIELSNQIQAPVVEFTIKNTGTVPARFIDIDDDVQEHTYAQIELSSDNGQVQFWRLLTQRDAELIGVIEPGQSIEGRIRLSDSIVGTYLASDGTWNQFEITAILHYEQAQ